MFANIKANTFARCYVLEVAIFPNMLPTRIKVAEFSEEFPKNYYDQAVEGGFLMQATYVDGLRPVSISTNVQNKYMRLYMFILQLPITSRMHVIDILMCFFGKLFQLQLNTNLDSP